MVRILTISTLYPNEVQIRHGIFVEQRLRRLVESGQVDARVIAPVPWFPFSSARFGKYGDHARVPRRENRHGIDIEHPRYLMIPKVGMLLQPFFLTVSIFFAVRRLAAREFDFDVIDAHYFYPDGVAAAIAGMLLRKPVIITARGSDINLIAKLKIPRSMIKWAAARSVAVISVSRALKTAMSDLGVDPGKIELLRNGVDLDLFRPANGTYRDRSRRVGQCELLTVGNLNKAKGHHLAIEALKVLPEARLTIVGEGEERHNLESLARSLGVEDRVTFTASVIQEELLNYYHAADILILASAREGMPNVVLEALACGVPVVATRVGGIPEIIFGEAAGILIDERASNALADGVVRLLGRYPNRSDTRRHAEQFGWDDTVRRQICVYHQAAMQSDGVASRDAGPRLNSDD